MTQETVNEIRQRYVDRTSKYRLSKLYRCTLSEVYQITKGLVMNPRKSTSLERALEKKEDVIMMHLNGFKKVEIEAKTGLTPYFVTTFINEFERATTPKRNVDENLEAIRRQEAKLIDMATEISKGKGDYQKYKVLLSVHAAAEPFHGGVFEV